MLQSSEGLWCLVIDADIGWWQHSGGVSAFVEPHLRIVFAALKQFIDGEQYLGRWQNWAFRIVTELVLRATGAETFYVFGLPTEVCVKLAAEGLLERGFAVRLVEDAIWPIDPAVGDAALLDLEERGAVRVKTEAVLGLPVGGEA